MAEAEWFCHVCDTHGGGPPCNQTMTEHIDEVHDGGLARMEKV